MESKKIYERIRDFYRTGNTLVKDDIPYKVRIVEAIKNNYHRLQEVTKQVPPNLSAQDSTNFVIDKFLMEKFYPTRSYEIALNG